MEAENVTKKFSEMITHVLELKKKKTIMTNAV